MTNNATTGTDYELPTTIAANEHHQGPNDIEKLDENNKQVEEKEDDETMQASSISTVHVDETGQDEDISIEENVVPFYMNSGRFFE